MAKTQITMPSSIATVSTENDSANSPMQHRDIEGDSPATSTSSPDRSPREHVNGNDHPTKRKRSDSLQEHNPSSRHYDYSPPPKKNEHPQQMAGRALNAMSSSTATPVRQYFSPTEDGPPRYYPEDRPMQSQEEAGREAHGYATPPPGVSSHGTEGSGSPPPHSNGQAQAGKRKRNFSNRTKTGCITCRQRKKKCDEARPICNNCSRGGFPCQGYTVVRGNSWPKANGTKTPVPLQSKEGHVNGQESEPTTTHPPHIASHPPPAPTDANPDSSHGQYSAGAESRSRPTYAGQTWPPQQGHPYTNDHLPPLAEFTRSDKQKPDYPPPPPPPPPPQQQPPPPTASRDMSRPNQSLQPSGPPGPTPQPTHWPPQSEFRTSYPPPPRLETHHNPPPMRVSTSQYDYQKSGAKTFTVEEVERSRMLRHTRFNYFDSTLKNERQRCAEALARYNNACMLRSGVTEQEAQNMLMKVFDPSLDLTHHPVAPCKEKGVLGPGVKVEGPFKCTYGYNLRIMDNVFIGENTRIDDSARVDIGARTWIGPNVTILTTDVSKDMVDRKGTESTCYAAPVVIHPEVVIGSNAVIYPGVTLSRGSTVEPFAVVRDSLGENQIQRAAVGPRAAA